MENNQAPQNNEAQMPTVENPVPQENQTPETPPQESPKKQEIEKKKNRFFKLVKTVVLAIIGLIIFLILFSVGRQTYLKNKSTFVVDTGSEDNENGDIVIKKENFRNYGSS